MQATFPPPAALAVPVRGGPWPPLPPRVVELLPTLASSTQLTPSHAPQAYESPANLSDSSPNRLLVKERPMHFK
ncbi:Hypothetical protein NTJ_06972 [Nesidiocoris tenuis]|uniref:Uncharacterized protein n=1 Tax=Nesidiocoris tenuis TaxID=355587 RepID=A0ABN7AQB2_9HEMI|nr:Hypothetical protein NTJ_06972 [Nesidiocoris tenuis]